MQGPKRWAVVLALLSIGCGGAGCGWTVPRAARVAPTTHPAPAAGHGGLADAGAAELTPSD